MPELAEVEYYRQRWNPGLGARVKGVRLHSANRVFRGVDVGALKRSLPGSLLVGSEAHGKQMLFCFSKDLWLGLHLGMTGELRVEPAGYRPGKHEHLAIEQPSQTLVFSDPRQFGRVRFHLGREAPEWWSNLPPPLLSKSFTLATMQRLLERHRKLPLKAALLLQSGFPGLGNWMADEILWRAGLDPHTPAGRLAAAELESLWRTIRFVCRQSIKSVARGYSALPAGWLFHERWESAGRCPRHGKVLARETIGGRTTAWCLDCQGARQAERALSRSRRR